MCKIEERVYIGDNGRSEKYEHTTPCRKATPTSLCSKVTRETRQYYMPSPSSRDGTSSPSSIDPPTPNGSGTYHVEQHRPSSSGRRNSFRDGSRAIKPEIVIEVGSRKSKKYPPSVSFQTRYKRSSLGASSIASNEGTIDSPGSDASSNRVRTGYPEATVPPVAFDPSYSRTALPSHHRHASSASSFTSSQTPSLYHVSEPDSPTLRNRTARQQPAIVHQQTPASSKPSRDDPFKTKVVQPQRTTQDALAPDGLTPLSYSSFSTPSASASYAPEVIGRANARDQLRRQNLEKSRQEDADRAYAEQLQKEEEKKRAREEEQKKVRFEEDERADRERRRQKAENDRRRADEERRRAEDDRRRVEEERRKADEDKRRKQKIKDDLARAKEEVKAAEARASRRERERERDRDPRPPTRDFNIGGTSSHHRRRRSISRADAETRKHLLANEEAVMAEERARADERDREERAGLLRQKQADPQYWDPRGGALGRRNSVSQRGGVSIIQDNPPPPTSPYSTRAPPTATSHYQNPPPLLVPAPAPPTNYSTRNHHDTYRPENPFAQPPNSAGVQQHAGNPFATSATAGSAVGATAGATADFWDERTRQDALPRVSAQTQGQAQGLGLGIGLAEHSLRRRGEEVISRAAGPRQATRKLGRVAGYEDEYEDSEEEESRGRFGGRLGRR
ncbi:hypothetical protein BS50DRAFT_341693 [Corynespora cassiicola Philippines]|uniref:Uncharacterized protein n=1 Tax=Corynespora cassiicola Philippines TaxID=1448308 RepID=A0A2T2NVG2_CORCC|nr:hypothetical protein BS50DRAFT_341693 [Corynespora cassiicola Philippines]